MSSDVLFYPMLAHVLLVLFLYALLTLFRAPAVWGLARKSKHTRSWKTLESKVSANLSNQFEWPMMFYAVSVMLMSKYPLVSSAYVWAAWVFIAGRVLHSWVQVGTENVRLRGVIFTINFVAVLAMWFLLFLQTSGADDNANLFHAM